MHGGQRHERPLVLSLWLPFSPTFLSANLFSFRISLPRSSCCFFFFIHFFSIPSLFIPATQHRPPHPTSFIHCTSGKQKTSPWRSTQPLLLSTTVLLCTPSGPRSLLSVQVWLDSPW